LFTLQCSLLFRLGGFFHCDHLGLWTSTTKTIPISSTTKTIPISSHSSILIPYPSPVIIAITTTILGIVYTRRIAKREQPREATDQRWLRLVQVCKRWFCAEQLAQDSAVQTC
jgi:hypothetical protein